MIFEAERVPVAEFERVSGWRLKQEGLCRDDRCLPFRSADPRTVDLATAAAALGTPLVLDAAHGLWALGAQAGGALLSATAPDLELPDLRGARFRLSSLRGRKVVLVAWASW